MTDAHIGQVLSRLLGGKEALGFRLYYSIRNSSVRNDLLQVIVDDRAPKRKAKRIQNAFDSVESTLKDRHRLAHGIWVQDLDAVDDLIVVDTKDLTQYMEESLTYLVRNHGLVYTLDDLDRALRGIKALNRELVEIAVALPARRARRSASRERPKDSQQSPRLPLSPPAKQK